MPWTIANPPPPAKNWTKGEKIKCVAAANAVLADTNSESQAIFACIHAAGKSTRNSMLIQNEDGTHSWEVEIFRTGIWNGDQFVLEDLEEIVVNFEMFKEGNRVPLKFGHDFDQSLLGDQIDGEPAIGWIEELRIENNKLIARFDHVPPIVVSLIEAKLYRNVSAEILINVKHKGVRVGKMLIGVALLGADLPAINNLEELGAFLTVDNESAAHFFKNFSAEMVKAYNISDFTNVEAAKYIHVRINQEDNMEAAKEQELKDLKDKNTKLEETVRVQNFENQKGSFLNKLELYIKDGKIAPSVREQLEKEVDEQVKTFTSQSNLSFDCETIFKLFDNNSVLPKGETATNNGGSETPLVNTPDQVVMKKAKTLVMEKKVKDLKEGISQVLADDPKLGKEWTSYKDNPEEYQKTLSKGA